MITTKDTAGIVGIILAAGRSRRMGAFKPLLPFGSTTVIESCIAGLRDGGVDTIVVVTGHRAEELREHLRNSRVIIVENPDPDGEMTSSIACAVRSVSMAEGAFVITPGDYPAIPAEVISELLGEWQQGALLVKPIYSDRGGHPVVVDISLRDQLMQLDPKRGLKSLFEQYSDQVKRVRVQSNYVARDLDTWDDYATLHQEVFGVPPTALKLDKSK